MFITPQNLEKLEELNSVIREFDPKKQIVIIEKLEEGFSLEVVVPSVFTEEELKVHIEPLTEDLTATEQVEELNEIFEQLLEDFAPEIKRFIRIKNTYKDELDNELKRWKAKMN